MIIICFWRVVDDSQDRTRVPLAMASIFRLVSRFVSWHVYCLFDYLDPVAGSSWIDELSNAESSSSWDSTFLFPVLLLLFTSLYGTLGMEYASSEKESFKFSKLTNSSTVFNHQIASQDIWLFYDKVISLCVLASIAMYASFWKRPFTLQNYRQTVDKHGMTLLLFVGKGTNLDWQRNTSIYFFALGSDWESNCGSRPLEWPNERCWSSHLHEKSGSTRFVQKLTVHLRAKVF